ncbi:MAG: hypothetical protein AAGA71_22280 [Pseudomonadota bacterium]
MSEQALAVLVFGALIALALVMFALERRGVAKRKAARGGREVDISDLVFFGAEAGQGEKIKVPGKD